MLIKRLSHISLSSRDLAATERFYVDVMGFCVAHEFRNAAGELYGFFLHAGGGTFLEFFFQPDTPPAIGAFRHVAFEVDDIERAAAHFRARGFPEIVIKRGRTDHILQFFITDPDGTQIEFQQHDEQSTLKGFVSGK